MTALLFVGGPLLIDNGIVNASSVADDIQDDAEDVMNYIDKMVKEGETQSSPDESDSANATVFVENGTNISQPRVPLPISPGNITNSNLIDTNITGR